jgi:two-component system nitrate/nitrite response regulator NarL
MCLNIFLTNRPDKEISRFQMPDDKIRILLINDTPLVCNLIASVLEDEEDIEVIGYTGSIEGALEEAENCDIMLVSTKIPDNGAITLTHRITEKNPEVKVLVLGLTESRQQILHFIEAGADGYVLKDHSVEDLLDRIRAAQNQKAYVSPQIAAALMNRLSELAQLFSDVEAGINNTMNLTPREIEVLELIGEGYNNQDIADSLVIEVGTVKNHVHSILQKLDVSNREDAAAYLAIISKEQGVE